VSPTGGYVALLILNGTGGAPKTAFYRHEKSYVALLKIEGKSLRKVAQADVGGSPKGSRSAPTGNTSTWGNFVEGDIDILRRDGDSLVKLGSFSLQGHPASMRGSTP